MNDDRNVDPTIGELLSQHALQCLDAEAAARVRKLMTDDPALAREAAELERTLELLALSSQRPPPTHLRGRVLAAAQAAQSQPANRPQADELAAARAKATQRTARRWPLYVTTSLAAAASVACALLLLDRANLKTERDQMAHQAEMEIQAASALLDPNVVMSFPMGGRSTAASALGYVMLDLDARRASISVRNLPAAPAGHSYHLWAVLENKNVACGRFTPEKDGRILTRFEIPVDSYTSPIQKLILTVEPDSVQTVPRGATVMTS